MADSMILRKFIIIIFYIFISNFAFSQTQEIDNKDTISQCDINTINGITCLINFSEKHSKLNPDSNIVFLNNVIGIINNTPNYNQQTKLLFINGYIYFFQKEYVKAIKNLKRNLEIDNNNKNYQLKQEIYSTLGVIYQRLNYPKEAIFHYLKSLEIQKTFAKDTSKICDLFVLLGHANIGLHNFKKSLNYYEKSLQLARLSTNNSAIVRAYINIGNLYLRKKEYNEAVKFTRKSLKLSIKYNYEEKISICYLNLAEIYFLTKEYEKAIKYYITTIKSIKSDNLSFIIPFCYKDLARIYSKQNKTKLKEEAIINHYKHIYKYDSGLRLAQSLRDLNKMFKNDNNSSFTNKYLIKNTELLDSILISENNNRILMIESLHDLEKGKIINQKKLSNFRLAIIYGSVILLLFIVIIILLIYTRKKIIAQSIQITEQNSNIQAQNEEIKNQNEILWKYKNQLEIKVAKRTDELEISLLKAEESNKLKTNFLNNLSHEIRTPMNAIIGFSQILEFNDNDPNKGYIEIIEKHSNELMVFLENIVKLSKIQSGSEKLNISKISILEFLKKICKEVDYIKAQLDKNNIEFELTENNFAYNETLNTDRIKLFSIIVQILENAFKFTVKGKVKLSCLQKTEKLIFIIQDTGIGIDESIRPFIFDAFRKIEDGKKIFRGTGVGLALAKNTIELLKGSISVESEINKGSKFIISIPNIQNS